MAVPRVYVRRRTTVWSGTNIYSHQTSDTGRTNIDFFIPTALRSVSDGGGGSDFRFFATQKTSR